MKKNQKFLVPAAALLLACNMALTVGATGVTGATIPTNPTNATTPTSPTTPTTPTTPTNPTTPTTPTEPTTPTNPTNPTTPTNPTEPTTPDQPDTPVTPVTPVTPGGTTTVKPSDELAFTDVAAGSYYEAAVKWAVANGIVNGTTTTTFSPAKTCSRAQCVTFLWRAAGSPEPKGTASLPDVQSGSYYEKAAQWAAEQGIVLGTADGQFAPEANVTRAQVVTFLYRLSKATTAKTTSFSDVRADSFCAESVAWAAENGITKGTMPTTFAPGRDCSRAQIVTFLYRYFAK